MRSGCWVRAPQPWVTGAGLADVVPSRLLLVASAGNPTINGSSHRNV